MTDANSVSDAALDSLCGDYPNPKYALTDVLAKELHLVDSFRLCHPGRRRFTRVRTNLEKEEMTIHVSSSRIDQIWWSSSLLALCSMTTASIDARNAVIPSDHFPVCALALFIAK